MQNISSFRGFTLRTQLAFVIASKAKQSRVMTRDCHVSAKARDSSARGRIRPLADNDERSAWDLNKTTRGLKGFGLSFFRNPESGGQTGAFGFSSQGKNNGGDKVSFSGTQVFFAVI